YDPPRAVSVQRCVRAGGKHNDLDAIGRSPRHLSFFEMLGNFSFGDYFKRDAIGYAWELLTKVYGLDPNRMWTTVYHEDDEAYDIWTRDIGVPKERCVRIGDKPGAPKYQSDNFWQMADTGPCGPCSEIFWDHGPHIPGGPPGSKDADGDRYVEIWNLVFMQFNRDEAGTMVPLPKPSVDTGMGLERIAAVLQKVHSNYEIDLFQNLIKAAARETHSKDYSSNSLKVVADHIRACSFLIVDGVIPSNEGRGYVLRRIIRRAIRHGYKLGQTDPFFHRIVGDLTRAMGEAYPELAKSADRVSQVLRQEEERFAETLANGMKVLEGALNREDRMLDGETVFQLYDTFGFPVDLTADIARERDVRVDYAGFEAAMERQRERARAASKFSAAANLEYRGAATEFHGYDALQLEAKVIALYDAEGVQAQEIAAGASGVVVLDRTPFYAESGGQVGDRGELAGVNGTFEVQDTQKIQAAVFGHKGVLKTGKLKVGDKVLAAVDIERRARTVRNHSATHLMHKALREVLGHHVQQKGSLVDAERTRFDFSHNEPLTDEQMRKVEAIVNAEILANAATTARIMKFDEAAKAGALAFFGDKYGDEVRVLDIGTSRELCGGTHVKRTGDIGFFKVTSEGGIAAGVRRIEATTGEGALAWVQAMEKGVSELASEAGFREKNLAGVRQRLASLQDANRALEKELARLKSKMASSRGDELVEQAVAVKGVKVVAAAIEGADAKALREAVDKLKDKLKSAAVVLATANDGKVSLIAGVTADISAKVKAGDLVNHVAQQVGGKGGGRADMAQAGGNDPSKLPQALDSVRAWVEQRLA
ncbi:MAG: alanine--tRNA ligase, partial [Betaproteobacteria bacterium]